QAVGDQLQLSWHEIHGILERAVKRGLARRQAEEIPYLGVDEQAFRKGHKYLTLVNDLQRNRVLYVAEDREQSSLDGFWSTITAEQRASIQAVALDMWDPYLASLNEHLPDAREKAVFDKFHVAKHLGEAVDKVRRREHKILLGHIQHAIPLQVVNQRQIFMSFAEGLFIHAQIRNLFGLASC